MTSELEQLAANVRSLAAAGRRSADSIAAQQTRVRGLPARLPTTPSPHSAAIRESLYAAEQALARAGRAMDDFARTSARFADNLATGGAAASASSTGTGKAPDGGDATSAWADVPLPEGMSMVSLDSIDTGDRRISAADFSKGYSPDDLAWAHQAFNDVILPGLRDGKTLDDFRTLDAAQGRSGTRSYADTYSGFLGDSAVHLSPGAGGRWAVGNGYHRIWVARRLGLTHLPARTSH